MGYYVTLTAADWNIPENEEVLAVLKAMNQKYRGRKRGGGGGQEWFSWMPANYDETVTSVQDVFTMLGFDVELRHGFVSLIGYDNKRGQEELFVAETAPFVADGSFMEWQGEEGETWRWTVADGKMREAHGSITWGPASPYKYAHYRVDAPGTMGRIEYIDPYEVPLPS